MRGGGEILMHYFSEVFYGNLTIFVLLESLVFGMVVSLSIYFFSKNKWGSILLSVPFSAIYLYMIYRYSFHLYFIAIELLMQYALINIISIVANQKNKK